jgi:hypothetical protein
MMVQLTMTRNLLHVPEGPPEAPLPAFEPVSPDLGPAPPPSAPATPDGSDDDAPMDSADELSRPAFMPDVPLSQGAQVAPLGSLARRGPSGVL